MFGEKKEARLPEKWKSLNVHDNRKALGVSTRLFLSNSFADNGHTSPQQLKDAYLRFIDLEKTAIEAREKIETSREVLWGGKYKSRKDVESSNHS